MYEFWFAIFIELQKAKDEENYFKESFDKQLCNERTLKIQVCVWVPAQVWKVCYTLFFACYSCVTSVVKSNFLLQGCVELWVKVTETYNILLQAFLLNLPGLYLS